VSKSNPGGSSEQTTQAELIGVGDHTMILPEDKMLAKTLLRKLQDAEMDSEMMAVEEFKNLTFVQLVEGLEFAMAVSDIENPEVELLTVHREVAVALREMISRLAELGYAQNSVGDFFRGQTLLEYFGPNKKKLLMGDDFSKFVAESLSTTFSSFFSWENVVSITFVQAVCTILYWVGMSYHAGRPRNPVEVFAEKTVTLIPILNFQVSIGYIILINVIAFINAKAGQKVLPTPAAMPSKPVVLRHGRSPTRRLKQ
jgi:hypothetical protein